MSEAVERALGAAKGLLADTTGGDAEALAAKALAVLAPFQNGEDTVHPHVPFLTGAALQRLGRHSQAAEHYERSLHLQPELIHARTNLIHAYLALEPPRLDAALRHAEEAVAREPQNAERLWLQAHVLERAGKDELAQRALQRCLVLDPRNIRAYVNLDASYLRAGRVEAARTLAGLALREKERSGGVFSFWQHPLQRPPHVHKVRVGSMRAET